MNKKILFSILLSDVTFRGFSVAKLLEPYKSYITDSEGLGRSKWTGTANMMKLATLIFVLSVASQVMYFSEIHYGGGGWPVHLEVQIIMRGLSKMAGFKLMFKTSRQ